MAYKFNISHLEHRNSKRMADTISRIFSPTVRGGFPLANRITCIESVLPPLTTSPLLTFCHIARAIATQSTP